MATKDYFNRIHRKIVQNTGASTSLRNQNDLNSFLTRVRQDIANLTNYVNEIVYPIFQGPGMERSNESILCWGPKWEFDAVLDGLAATSLQTFPEEHGGGPYAPECYWFDDGLGGGRPRSIKETFDCLMAMISEQEVLIQEKEPDLSDIYEQLQCLAANDERIVKDSFGCNYNLTCSDSHTKEWPIGKHIFEIFNQIISGHGNLSELGIADPVAGIEADPNVCSGTPYPNLHITVNQSDVFPDICIEPWKICGICDPDGWDPGGAGSSIGDDIREIVLRIGGVAGVSPGGDPTYCLGPALESACFNAINNKSLSEAIELIAEELCQKCEAAYDQVHLSADGGNVANDLFLTTEDCNGTLEFIAGPNITLTGTSGDPDKIKIEATNWVPTGILGNLNDAYHFADNPFFHFGIIALENTYENIVVNNNNWSPACVPKAGAGVYLMDDTTELKSKLLAVVSDGKLGGTNYLDPSGPSKAYFSVGDHWGLERLKDMLLNGDITQSEYDMYSRAWSKHKIVHTEDSIFYTKQVKNYSDNVFLPTTAGFNNNGSINPETGNPGPPEHGVTCPNEGAIWISEGHEAVNPNFPSQPILDGCEEPLEAGHLYYRMPGDGAVWKLSGCGGAGGNLQDSYDFDKDSDTQADGGRIMLRPESEVQNRSFWLMQHSNFITPGLASDYWYTPGPPLTSTSGSNADPDCPYYIPWFAVTDELPASNPDSPIGPVGPDDGIGNASILDRFFSIQYRDQCFLYEPEGCCCDFDEEGNPVNPKEEWLYEVGGFGNVKHLNSCASAPACDYSDAFGWVDPSNFPPEHAGIKQVSIHEGQCFWVDLFPIFGSSSTETSYTCWKALSEKTLTGEAHYQIDYSCSCVIDVDGVPTPHVLIRDISQNPYAAFGAGWKIDTRCLPCCSTFEEPNEVWMYPLVQIQPPNLTVGESTVAVPVGEHIEQMHSLLTEGVSDIMFYDPNNTGSLTHVVPPVDNSGPCYWNDSILGPCKAGGTSLTGFPVESDGVTPVGSLYNPPGSLNQLVSEDSLNATGLAPGDTIRYSVGDCTWVSYDAYPEIPEIDTTVRISQTCLTEHEYEVTQCWWTNDHLASLNQSGNRFTDGDGNAWPGGKKFHGLLGPALGCPDMSRYWEVDCFILPLWIILYGMGESVKASEGQANVLVAAENMSYQEGMTTQDVAAVLETEVTYVRTSEKGLHFSDELLRIGANAGRLFEYLPKEQLDEIAVRNQLWLEGLRQYILSESFTKSPLALEPSKILDPKIFTELMTVFASREEFGEYALRKSSSSEQTHPAAFSTQSGFPVDDCDYYFWAETVQDPVDPTQGEFRVYYQGGTLGRDLCAVALQTNDLGLDFIPPGDDENSALTGDAINWVKNADLVGTPGSNFWGVNCPGSPAYPTCLQASNNPRLLISWRVQTTGGQPLPNASPQIRNCLVYVMDPNRVAQSSGSATSSSLFNFYSGLTGTQSGASAPICPPTVKVECCNDNTTAPGQDIYLNLRVNYNNETAPQLELWFNTPDPNGIFSEGLDSFTTLIDCDLLKDYYGNAIWSDWFDAANNPNGCDFSDTGRPSNGGASDIHGGLAHTNDWYFTIDSTQGSQSQFKLTGSRTSPSDSIVSDCLSATDGSASAPCDPDYDNATTDHTLLVSFTPGASFQSPNTGYSCYPHPDEGNSGLLSFEDCSVCACVQEQELCPTGYGIPTHCCEWDNEDTAAAVNSELVFKPLPGNKITLSSGIVANSVDIWMSLNTGVSWDDMSVVEFVIDTSCLMDAASGTQPIPPPIQTANLIAGAIVDCHWQISMNPIANTNKVQVIAWVDTSSTCCVPKPPVSAYPCGSDTGDKVLLASFATQPYFSTPSPTQGCLGETPVLTNCGACSYCPEPEFECPTELVLSTYCCKPNDTTPIPVGTDIAYSVTGGTNTSSSTGLADGNNFITIRHAPVVNPPTYDKLQAFSFILCTRSLIDQAGNPLMGWDPVSGQMLTGIVGGPVVTAGWVCNLSPHQTGNVTDDGWFVHVEGYALSERQCLPTAPFNDSPCGDPLSSAPLIFLEILEDLTAGLVRKEVWDIVSTDDCDPLTACTACECSTNECVPGICCLEQPNPSVPSDCTPWPSVHFWQSPAYFSCMPKGWAPNTCESEGVIWVGSKNSDQTTDGLGKHCTIYYREPANGTIHDLTVGASGGQAGNKFAYFSADNYAQPGEGAGCINPSPVNYSAGLNDMFKLYALENIEFVTEDAVDGNGMPILPGNENAIGIGLCYGQNYPAAATKMSFKDFKYNLSITNNNQTYDGCLETLTPVGAPLMSLYAADQYSNEPSWRGLNMALSGSSTSVDMVYSLANSGDIQGSCLAFRRLKGFSSSSTSEPLTVRIGQYGDAEVVFNADVLPVGALKDVSAETKEDGDQLIWDSTTSEFRPSSIKLQDMLKLKPRTEFPTSANSCNRGAIIFLENNSAGLSSGFYVYDGLNWIEWLAF